MEKKKTKGKLKKREVKTEEKNYTGREELKRQNKDSLPKKHIEDGAGENGKQHIPFPTMYDYGKT